MQRIKFQLIRKRHNFQSRFQKRNATVLEIISLSKIIIDTNIINVAVRGAKPDHIIFLVVVAAVGVTQTFTRFDWSMQPSLGTYLAPMRAFQGSQQSRHRADSFYESLRPWVGGTQTAYSWLSS